MRPSSSSARIVRSERTMRPILRAARGRRQLVIQRCTYARRPCARICCSVATTRTIELKTEVPGPAVAGDPRRERRRVVAEPLSIYVPVDRGGGRGATRHRRRRQHVHRLHRRRRLPERRPRHTRASSAAAQEQVERFSHTDFTIVPYENYVDAGRAAARAAPISGPTKAAFFNSGAEAVENAVKFARSYTKRPAVIAFEGAFHGRTLLALSLTSKAHPYKAGLGPFAPEVYRVPFPNDYRGPDARTALDALERAFTTQVPPRQVAAIVIEPVQGEGGFVVCPRGLHRGLRGALRRARHRARRRRGADRRSPARDASSPWSTTASSPTWSPSPSRSPPGCRSRGCSGAPRSWTRRATPPSAAPTSATRWRRRRRWPCSTSIEDEGLCERAACDRRGDPRRMVGWEVALRRDRRRARARRDARDRDRARPRDEGAGA